MDNRGNKIKLPLVSVVMSVFNEKDNYLRYSIESILAQTYSNLELIVVIDGTDNTRNTKFLKSINDSRITYIISETNKGLSYSLNEAIKSSKGEYIFRMDSDDISVNNRIELQLNKLSSGALIVSSRAFLIDDKNIVNGLSGPVFFSNLVYGLLLYWTGRFNPVIHPSVAARRDVFLDNPYNSEIKYGQDYELWKRLYKNGIKIEFMKERLIFYRVKSDSKYKNDYQKNIMNTYK